MIWPLKMEDISPLASENVLFFQLYFSGFRLVKVYIAAVRFCNIILTTLFDSLMLVLILFTCTPFLYILVPTL